MRTFLIYSVTGAGVGTSGGRKHLTETITRKTGENLFAHWEIGLSQPGSGNHLTGGKDKKKKNRKHKDKDRGQIQEEEKAHTGQRQRQRPREKTRKLRGDESGNTKAGGKGERFFIIKQQLQKLQIMMRMTVMIRMTMMMRRMVMMTMTAVSMT